MHLHQSLPLVGSSFGQRNGIVVTCINKARVSNLRPTGSIPELHSRSNALPHIEVAVRIEASPLFLAFLAGQDETPCNAAIRFVIDKHQLLGGQLLHTEQGILILCIAGDVGKQGVSRETDITLFADITIFIRPIKLLKLP